MDNTLTVQYRPLDALIPEGLGQEEHLRLAKLLSHPFAQDPQVEPDLSVALNA